MASRTGTIARQISDELAAQGWDVNGESGHGGHKRITLVRDVGAKAVRIEVQCNPLVMDRVFGKTEWLNVSLGRENVKRFWIDWEIADGPDQDVMVAIGQLLVRSLHIYRDVLQGKGMAGKGAIMGEGIDQYGVGMESLTAEEEGI